MASSNITAQPISETRSNILSTSVTTSHPSSPSTLTEKWLHHLPICLDYCKNLSNMTQKSWCWLLSPPLRKNKAKIIPRTSKRNSRIYLKTGSIFSLRWLLKAVFTLTSCNRKKYQRKKEAMTRGSGSKQPLRICWQLTVNITLKFKTDKINNEKTQLTARVPCLKRTRGKTRKDISTSNCTKQSLFNLPSSPRVTITSGSRWSMKRSELIHKFIIN